MGEPQGATPVTNLNRALDDCGDTIDAYFDWLFDTLMGDITKADLDATERNLILTALISAKNRKEATRISTSPPRREARVVRLVPTPPPAAVPEPVDQSIRVDRGGTAPGSDITP